jgi:hypothetical protein
MTDKEKLLELLAGFGVQPDLTDDTAVVLHAGRGAVEGYVGFYCEFVFYPDGSFSHVGVSE